MKTGEDAKLPKEKVAQAAGEAEGCGDVGMAVKKKMVSCLLKVYGCAFKNS